ncbi:MAG: leucine-rich repeat domain-containing protein [Opitutales bacterium]
MQDEKKERLSAVEVVESAMRKKLKKKEGESFSDKEYDKVIRLFGAAKGRSGGDDALSLGEALDDLSALSKFKNLETLSLPRSGLSDLAPLSKQKKLIYLDLRHNEIENLSPLAGLPALIYLYLQGNRVKDPSPLGKLANLSYLTLVDNPVAEDRREKLRKALPNCRIFF